MKKILLITKFFPPEHGGIQSYLYNLILGLKNEKIFVMTHWSNSRKAVKNNDALTGVTPIGVTPKIYHANFRSPWRFLHLTTFDLFFKARRIIKQEKIEKILCGHLPIAGPLAFLIKKFYGLPYIVFSYGMEIFAIQKQSAEKQKMFKKILAEAEKIIVIADFMTGYLCKNFDIAPEKIAKIPPGVDSEVFRPIDNALTDVTPNNDWTNSRKAVKKTTLLTCGRLVARKNHISVIRALPQIIKEIPNVLYIIAGTGPEEQNLKNEVQRLHLENYVKFLGKVPEEDLPRLYNSADIFIMPSREIPKAGDVEGFGVVFLEAAACGLPCIGGNTGGQGEAIENGKTGFLVNPNSLDEIAAIIIKILKNPALAHALGSAGRARATEKFSWKTQIEKLKKIL